MEDSALIKKGQFLVESVKGTPLSIQERKNRAITLAALMMEEARRIQTSAEKKQQSQLAAMMNDPIGKVFTTTMTDQCFRSHRNQRIADQLAYVINRLGIPSYLPATQRLSLQALASFGKTLSSVAVPLTIHMIRKETSNVILPGEDKLLIHHMNKRRKEGVRINLNHLGEAILGEEEAKRRLEIYIEDLTKPEVEYISVKISTIFSQINLLAWDETIAILSDRLAQLYRTAMKHRYTRPDGISIPKFVNLDMEEYRDLLLTVAIFKEVLDQPEFYHYEGGIVLQSYLPDSFLIQQELTVWAMQRVAQGGAPIKIRLVKGANLAMEQFESALRLWPQTPYPSKSHVDANYKRMVTYGCQKEHAKAAHLGIGSHNLFDIAYALLLRSENECEQEVCFEMLEGMADHIRRVVQQLSNDMLLYCPAATKKEFQNAVAYLVRRLDENTAPDNFLRHAFDLQPGSQSWDQQVELFSTACLNIAQVPYLPRRTQNRLIEKFFPLSSCCFKNEADTDWALPQNRRWAEHILREWKSKPHSLIPLVIGGQTTTSCENIATGEDPSNPGHPLYRYCLATEQQVELVIKTAKENEEIWSQTPLKKRMELLANIANQLRSHRGDLIGAMVADTGKTVLEADVEVSEAIDFADYYRINLQDWHSLHDIEWKAKGTILITPPWNFPCSIAAGGILASLAAGNCVIFKPAVESILISWQLVQLFWKAGISRSTLQFITCEDDPVGSRLVKDPRISAIVLTGATSTAKLFLRMHPGIDLMAETGGKNVMIITGMSDRDVAIKDLVASAFGYAGQKCSACSIAILEAEVYDDPHFLQQLRDAAASMAVGSSWNLKTKINPLIHPPHPTLMRGLTQLEEGETWLLEPQQDSCYPNLWSPGIKLGVKPDSFTFKNELFGPILALVRADSFELALEWMNQTPYGLTAGIQSLDEREQSVWLKRVEAGNCYINRTMTGAIVERQPFGGCKESCFGKGAKAGGPNYLIQFMQPRQQQLPHEKGVLNPKVSALSLNVQKAAEFASQLNLWKSSLDSYAFFWREYFSKAHDPSLVMGQDNLQCYRPHPHLLLRGQEGDSALDLLRFIAAALTTATPLEVSLETQAIHDCVHEMGVSNYLSVKYETNEQLIKRLEADKIKRVRLLQKPPAFVLTALAEAACNLHVGDVIANGRLELLHLLQEVSISRDYHRYGHLGGREKEKRSSLIGCCDEQQLQNCQRSSDQ